MGAFACLELARRGLRVVGMDRFHPPHGRGSHSGATRIYRAAYAEHPGYVPLALRAGELWDNLPAYGGAILHRSGMLSVDTEDGAFIQGIRDSARLHGLRVETLSRAEVESRYPAFALQHNECGVVEPGAGWIDVDSGLTLVHRLAREAKAELLMDCPVSAWTSRGDSLAIETLAGPITASRLILTAGAGNGGLLGTLGLPLVVERKILTWIAPLRPELFTPDRFPVFGHGERFFYGFPSTAEGVKIAVHWESGDTVSRPEHPVREAAIEDADSALAAASRLLPQLAGPLPTARERVVKMATCLYTMTPDHHFIIDRHPLSANVVFAAGFSGHGFKFAPAIGEVLADLITSGESKLPVEFLKLGSRFAVSSSKGTD